MNSQYTKIEILQLGTNYCDNLIGDLKLTFRTLSVEKDVKLMFNYLYDYLYLPVWLFLCPL